MMKIDPNDWIISGAFSEFFPEPTADDAAVIWRSEEMLENAIWEAGERGGAGAESFARTW